MNLKDAPKKALIIDSDNVRRGMLACMLPASRYSLEFANSLEKGLDLIATKTPTVVIVGRLSGRSDFCQRIRALPAGNRCLIVLMDERFRDQNLGRAESEEAGADTFVPFPFDCELLEERIQQKERRSSSTFAALVQQEELREPPASDPLLQTVKKPTSVDNEAAWQRLRDRIGFIYSKMNTWDYYQLLEIPSDAPPAAVKEAFFRYSMEYHPDRYMQLTDEDLKTKIYEVYKRISEAFKVLANPETRSRYDLSLQGTSRNKSLRFRERTAAHCVPSDETSDAKTPAGKKYLHYANVAAYEGKYRSARVYLTMAVQYEPDNEALQIRLEEISQKLK